MHASPRIRRTLAAGLSVLIFTSVLVSSVGSATAGDPPGPATPIGDPIPGHIENGAIQLELETLAEGAGLTAPNWGTFAPGVPGFLFVVDQDGPLWAVNTANGQKAEVLNTAPLLVPLILDADERGFLGAAFHPGFAANGLLYTLTSERIPGTAGAPNEQPNHLSVLREWRLPNPTANPLTRAPLATTASRIVTTIVQPQFNHNGGALFFGTRPADRNFLYITSGDGGCADDQFGQLGLAEEGPCISL